MNTTEPDDPLVHRRGKFVISEVQLRRNATDFMKVMAECVVVRCELKFDTMSFEYDAISPHFEIVPEWQSAPEYGVVMERVRVGTDDSEQFETRFKGFIPSDRPQ